MEAHSLLKREGFEVSSYGTGAHVKLPGPSLREPNVYDFGTPYKQMYDDLRRKDSELYPLLLLQFPCRCLVAEKIMAN
jgi:RNA polymerase II subunit A C-terminal domain phosphatase SSU72